MRRTTELERALATDPIMDFEARTRKSYRDNNEAENRAMLASCIGFNLYKEKLLKQAGDTAFSMSGEEYAANIEAFGFVEVYSEPFTADRYGKTFEDVLKVYWHPWGLLLRFDTYNGQRNGGNVYYNWKPYDGADWHSCVSSGSFADADGECIWVGYHDCREALRYNMRQLREHGELLPVWKYRPRTLWITHYADRDICVGKPAEYERLTQDRLAKLPTHVQQAILFNGEPYNEIY